MSESFETSKDSGKHFLLNKLVGEWEGIARTWFEPGKIAEESPVLGNMRLILGRRFIMHEYKGSFGDKPLEGLAIYGYHPEIEKFQSAWVDSFHTGTALIFPEGKKGADSLAMLGSYPYVTHEMEQSWG